MTTLHQAMFRLRSKVVRIHPLTVVCWALLGCVLASFVVAGLSAIHQGRYKDFGEFYAAAEAMRDGRDIYAVGTDGYIYPPLLAFLLIPLVGLGLPAADAIWLAINCLLLVGSLTLAARVLRDRLGLGPQPRLATVAVALAVFFNMDKLHAEFVFGQSDLWLLASWVLGLHWMERRPWAAGAALGFAANIKYLSLVTIPYLILRGRYRAAAATCAATLAWAALPALYLGWTRNLEYDTRALRGFTGMLLASHLPETARVSGIGDDLSVSITSWAVRCTGTGHPNTHTLELLATIAAELLLLLWAIYLPDALSARRLRPPESADGTGQAGGMVAIEWVGLLAMALAFGPQTNSRHLSMLVLLFLTALMLGLSLALRCTRWPIWIGMGILMAGLTLPPSQDRFASWVCMWRWCGGASWCVVAMYGLVLWTARQHLNGARQSRTAEGQ